MQKQDNKFKVEFEFTLQRAITYQGDAEDVQTTSLLVRAPCNRQEEVVDELYSIIACAMLSMSKLVGVTAEDSKKEVKKDNKDSISGSSVLFALKAAGKIKDAKILFKKLLLDGCCLVNRNISLTEWHLSQIACVPPIDDFSRLMRDYLENFFIPSLTEVLTPTDNI